MSWVLFQDKCEFVVENNDKLEEQMASLSSSFLSLKLGGTSRALLHRIAALCLLSVFLKWLSFLGSTGEISVGREWREAEAYWNR